MARKVIIDCDPGIDDAVALCIALFDSDLEVVAITATAGNVRGEQTSRNVQAIIEQLDPPRYPRIGAAGAPPDSAGPDARSIHGNDGLGNVGFEVSRLQHRHPSDKLICDEVHAAPDEVSLICLGPLTNVARAMSRDPSLCENLNRLVMVGGSVEAVGNVTPAAEFNIHYDPSSAQAVFRSPVTKTLVPLDVTRRVPITLDFVQRFPHESTRAGAFLRKVVPPLFRAFHQRGQESIFLHDAVGLIAAIHPEFFETTEMAGDVEVMGSLTRGMTVFDRRPVPDWRPNMEVVTGLKKTAVHDAIELGLRRAGGHG